MLDVFNAVKTVCGDSAAATLTSLTGYLYTMRTLLNQTGDNCTDGKFSYIVGDFGIWIVYNKNIIVNDFVVCL